MKWRGRMINHLNYGHLLYFKTIVEQGGISKAAKILRIGAPAISMQIKIFEDRLQKKLFIRENKRLVLTETGRVVFQYAQEIFDLGDELMTTLNDQTHAQTTIQIGVQDCVPKNLISQLTSYIYRQFDSKVSVFNGGLEEMIAGVIKHRFDLVILNEPPVSKDRNIISRCLLKSQVVLAGSKDFLHLKNRPLSSFSNVPFILPTGQNSLRPKFDLHFSKKNIPIAVAGEAQDTVIQKNMAISGDGIIPIMKDAILSYVKNQQLFILKEVNGLSDELWLISTKRVIKNPVAEEIIKNYKFGL
jgi:LysR family transcriptional activator of nhaA